MRLPKLPHETRAECDKFRRFSYAARARHKRAPRAQERRRVDPKLVYWTAAWLNMALIVGLGVTGLLQISRRRFETHRRLMLTAAWLVAAFVLSYAVKLYALGRE